MPQPPTPQMGLIAPTPGSDPNGWGTILNTLIDILDAHTHKAGSGVKIGATAIQWDADITAAFAGTAYALLGTRAVDFTPVTAASVASLSSAVFTNSSDANNLYFRNAAGQNVRITNGATLDITAVGAFAGDYTSAGAEAGFTDGADTYYFKQQVGAAVRQYARMQSADIDLYEYKAHPAAGVPTNRIRIASPAALAASYALTLPGALPAADAVLQVSTAGVVTFKTTVATFNIAACAAALPSASAPTYTVNDTTGEAIWTFASGNRIALPAGMLRTGDRITGFGIRADSTAGGSSTLETKLWRKTSTAAPTQIGTTLSHTNTTTDQAQTLGAPEVVDAGDEFHLTVRSTAGSAAVFYSVAITVDRP